MNFRDLISQDLEEGETTWDIESGHLTVRIERNNWPSSSKEGGIIKTFAVNNVSKLKLLDLFTQSLWTRVITDFT